MDRDRTAGWTYIHALRKEWLFYYLLCYGLHYLLGLTAVSSTVLVSLGPETVNASVYQVARFIAPISVASFGFLKLSQWARAFNMAHRRIKLACIKYNLSEKYTDSQFLLDVQEAQWVVEHEESQLLTQSSIDLNTKTTLSKPRG